jgi:UDP-N-acetyl-D-glucosamine dehydrogenase
MTLKEKINNKRATIGVVGLGYVGLPLAVEYATRGYRTIGVDTDKSKVKSIISGKNYIADVNNDLFKRAVRRGLLKATDSYKSVVSMDVVFICVPTPFTANKEPDISYIMTSVKEISAYLKKNQVVILKSTTFPNTTEGYVMPVLERSGLKAGKDFFLAFSPERIDPGNKQWNTSNTPIVVGGINEKSTEYAALTLSKVVKKVVPVSSPKIAEMEKLLENIFRSVNIALVNEMAQLCDRMGGMNIWEVIDAASTKPFGFMPFYPGPGIGGHCILIDPYYLSWLARSYDFHTNCIELAAETNESMPFYVKSMIQREISKMPIRYKDAKILLLGVAFKKNVNDIRHSPALKIMQLLLADGAGNLSYNDPYVPKIVLMGKQFSSISLTKENLRKYDCVLITTDHSDYNYNHIVKHAKKVIDTRNATKNIKAGREKIVVLGEGK